MITTATLSYTQGYLFVTKKIEGKVYGTFEGKVSTFKYIEGVDLNLINTFSYFNEENIKRESILNSSFNLIN